MTARVERHRALLSCSRRAQAALRPIVEETEALLYRLNWRSRLPRRAAPGSVDLAERRRLREESYEEIERSAVVLHVPAPGPLAGPVLTRELQCAVRLARPVMLLVCGDLRLEHGIAAPDEELLELLKAATGGRVLRGLDELEALLLSWPATPLQD